jgi:hypothetical protein
MQGKLTFSFRAGANSATVLRFQQSGESMSEEKKRPTATAYAVRNFEQKGKKEASWLKVGAAWMHKDGKGFDVVLEATPVSGRVVVRLNDTEEES